jgi:type IV pilus assembly protein PilC
VSTYTYRAATPAGAVRRGRLAALNLQELEARLRLLGLDLIEAQPHALSRWARGASIPRRELISFCVHLETTLTARVQLIDALADLAESTTHPRFREVASVVHDRVREGASLSVALREYPQAFDAVFVGLVESGERSGKLDEVFARLAANLKWQDEIVSATKKALTYPGFTLVVILAAALFILLYLVPQLAEFIRTASGGVLPFQTRLLLALSEGVQDYWYLIPVPPLLVGAAWLFVARSGSEDLKRRVDAARLRLPVVGPILSRLAIARFAGLFGMLYASGVPVLVSLEVAEGAMGNRALAEAAQRARARIAQGSSMTDAFAEAALFPNLLLRMVRIGETTGEIDKAMRNVTYFYEREIQDSVQRLEALAEPVLTMMLGLLLGWLMLAVLGPLYDMLSKMKM